MNISAITKCVIILIAVSMSLTCRAANVTWDGSESSDWANGLNWDNNTGPAAGDVANINSGTVKFSSGATPSLNALQLLGGSLTFSGGTFNCAASSAWDSRVEGTLYHTGTTASINELEIGRTVGNNGVYYLSGGSLNIARGLGGYSLHIGSNKSLVNAGTGTFEISGGALTTRSGIKLGDATKTGIGKFTVLGSSITQIGIASGNTDTDGTWKQHAGSTLKVGIDFGGVTRIFIDDSPTATTGTSATFENGSLLDVGYYSTGYGGGTWTVLEVENGPVINNGLAFAAGVNTSIWSFSIDNSGPNGVLKVTATGEPAGIDLNVGNAKKQKMRYGLDYERLWYWSGSTANKNTVARWSMVDCDVDYIRVAMNAEYELTEGTYNLTAYTDKIIPMMQAMKAAKPDIKFFATPRPLNESSGYSNAAWQPYPYWITGDPGNGSSFSFNWQKCAEYLVRYINLMKSYGFKISFMDLTNEWNYVDSGDYRDIKAYMVANLAAEDIPLLRGTLSLELHPRRKLAERRHHFLAQGRRGDRRPATTPIRPEPPRISHNRAASILPGKEIWNTEVHGWKSTSGADEALSAAYMFECIRAGFSGLNGWLAIGTPNQGHSYILNENSTVTRNVKYFIFRKLSSTSNYGNALDINQPAEFSVGIGSDQADAATSTAALIRGNLMTVWVMNHSVNSWPIRIKPTGRTLSESTVKRTRWSASAGLPVEGVNDQIGVTTNSSVWSPVAPNSLYCFEILLDPVGPQFTKIEAESFAAKSGTNTETCTDIGGGLDVGSIGNNTWLRFDSLAPGSDPVIRFRVARPAGRPDGKIEVRLDSITGTLIGSIAVPETGGWQTWETIEATLAPVTGSHSIYFKFVETSGSTGNAMFNLNWFALNMPQPPTGLTAGPASATQVNLAWNAVPGATGYNVKRSTTSGGPYTTVSSGQTPTSLNNTGLTAGTRYYYVASAQYGGTESGNTTEVSSVPSGPIVPEDAVIRSMVVGSDGAGGNKLTLSILKTGVGQFYQVVSAENLTNPVWQNASGVFSGNGGLLQFDIPFLPGASQKFYKVKVWRE